VRNDNIKSVLFVSVENSCRSQVAEACGRMLGQGLIIVYSCRSNPSGVVNPKAIEAMRDIGYDLTAHASVALDTLPLTRFDYVTTMGCGDRCPMVQANHREDWAIPDPEHLETVEFNKTRDLIRDKVTDLIARIKMATDPV
jgi:protein-tyrosine-phosphatase